MKILVINAGSSSFKCCLFTAEKNNAQSISTIWKAQIDWLDSLNSNDCLLTIEASGKSKFQEKISGKDYISTIKTLLQSCWTSDNAAIRDSAEIDIIGHRVVHGGIKYFSPTIITDQVIADLRTYTELAPSHEFTNIKCIEIARQIFKTIPQVAVFDTAFHHHMPESAVIYPGPYHWYEKLNIRRFGFHGISHEFCANHAAELINKDLASLKIITCHLGSGASLAAIKDGKCLMTTMGFTPLEGLVMSTRSGSIDPGLILYLLQHNIYSIDTLEQTLNHESGLKGISGISGDMRVIEEQASSGNKQAQLAFDIYVNSLAAHIASLVPTLEGLDALVFAGGIGENSKQVRLATCKKLAFLGVTIDPDKNTRCQPDSDISTNNALIKTIVIHTREDLAIAKSCLQMAIS